MAYGIIASNFLQEKAKYTEIIALDRSDKLMSGQDDVETKFQGGRDRDVMT